MKVRGYGVLVALVGLCLVAALLGGCFGSVDDTADPVASATTTAIPTVISTSELTPTPDLRPPTPTPEPPEWWTVAQSTWNDTFEVTLEIYGPSTITSQSELFARSRLRNVSDESRMYVQWTQFDPAVPLSIVLPSPEVAEDAEFRPAVRLIQLRAEDDPQPSISSAPAVRHETLDAGDSIEREVSWDLTVGEAGTREREPAPDSVYTLRADFYPEDGEVSPGLPDVVLEFAIRLERGIAEDRDEG